MAQLSAFPLESKTFAGGANLQIQLQSLPRGQRATHIMIQGECTAANASGSAKDIAPQNLWSTIATAILKTPRADIRATGVGLAIHYYASRGKTWANKTTTIADGSSATIRTYWMIPFSDVRAISPHDTAQPSELLEGNTLELVCRSALPTVSGLTLSNFQFYTTAWFIPGAGAVLPAKVKEDYIDWTGTSAMLPPGTWVDCIAYKEDIAAFSLTDYQRLDLTVDGVTVIKNLRTEQLVAQWDDVWGLGSEVDSEQVNPSSPQFLPIVVPPCQPYKISGLQAALGQPRLDITGNASSTRFLVRTLEQTSDADDNQALRLMGVAQPESVQKEVKTESKRALNPRPGFAVLARTLPKRANVVLAA